MAGKELENQGGNENYFFRAQNVTGSKENKYKFTSCLRALEKP